MYVITGASGHTGQRAAQQLLAAGQEVVVVGRSAERLAPLTAQGARAAIGDLSDEAFLTQTFRGARGVYALIPPNFAAPDFRAYQQQLSQTLARALRAAGVSRVVTLSSVGAHSPNTGVVAGLYDFEQTLAQTLPEADVLHLRAGFFMENFLGNIGLIKGMGIHGGFPIEGNIKLAIVHTRDIGDVAARRLLAADFSGHSHTYVAGAADLSMDEATAILGEAIGKPGLKWVAFPYDQAYQGMVQNGFPPSLAEQYVTFCKSVNTGELTVDYQPQPEYRTPTSLAEFARQEFAPAFAAAG